jgi:hypothetical protein
MNIRIKGFYERKIKMEVAKLKGDRFKVTRRENT